MIRSSRLILSSLLMALGGGGLGMPNGSLRDDGKLRKAPPDVNSGRDDPPKVGRVEVSRTAHPEFPTAPYVAGYNKPPMNGAREVARRQKQMARASAKAAAKQP